MAATLRIVGHSYRWIDESAREGERASELYRRLLGQARRKRLRSAITGHEMRLLTLASIERSCTIVACRDAETRSVPISQIRGSSSGRSCDFDAGFRPLHTHSRDRWLRLAAARLRGAKLPPIELVEVEGIYFVIDGHHRISVARALGDVVIQARVSTWQVAARVH